MIFPKLIFKVESWKFNKEYGVYVSTLGHFKDRQKRNLPYLINQNGYCAIRTERGVIQAHRLVLFTWRPIPNAEKFTVDHLNHNKRDNSLSNLEWVSRQENLRRATQDRIITDVEENNFYFIVNGIAFDSIVQAFDYIMAHVSKNHKGCVSFDQVNKYFQGLAREREKNSKIYREKSYCKMNLTVIKKGV